MTTETTSFNPRTWVVGEPAGAAATSTEAAPSAGKRPPVMIVAGIAASLLVAVGLWWWLADDDTQSAKVANPAAAASEKPIAPPAPTEARRIVLVRNLQDLGSALEEMGVPTSDAMAVARETVGALGVEDEEMRVEVVLRDIGPPGTAKQRVVQSIVAELGGGDGVQLIRRPDGSYAREENFLNAVTQTRSAEGSIRHATFYASALEAGIPDSLITPFAKAFSFDFDFQREVKEGDRFLAVWEERVTQQGRRLSPPQLVYARLTTTVGTRAYYAFIPPDEVEPRWFDANGNGAARGLMRTPVDGARITSKFGGRIHPIRGFLKMHNGTDFAAPTGTPIYASGNATVAAVLPLHGGAGNMIKLQHDEHMQTWYMHMSRFADGIAASQKVAQGDVIGYIGTTGGSTGPHLHYEIRIDGEPRDSLTFESTKVEPLIGEAKTMFAARRAQIDAARQ
jgi:murein DD-endopeptidase MepM/ murein hydrolase activator NlpD